MNLRKGSAGEKIERLQKILFRLAGKADDQVGGDGAAGEIPAQNVARKQETGSVIPPAHGTQRSVAAALQRKVKMRAQVAVYDQRTRELLGHGARFK